MWPHWHGRLVARALEAERVREHTHDLVRRPPPVSLRYAWHEGSTVAIRLGLRGGIPRYVFSPYFRRIFLMSEYGPKYAYFRMGGYVFNSTARGKPRFCPNLRFCLCIWDFRGKLTHRRPELIKFPMPVAPPWPSTVRSDDWPAWFSFWVSGCWRALSAVEYVTPHTKIRVFRSVFTHQKNTAKIRQKYVPRNTAT